jgi:hypothetical protein
MRPWLVREYVRVMCHMMHGVEVTGDRRGLRAAKWKLLDTSWKG